MRGRNDSWYEQFEISPETIEQELQTAVCIQRQTDRQTGRFKENYSIDEREYNVTGLNWSPFMVIAQKVNDIPLKRYRCAKLCLFDYIY